MHEAGHTKFILLTVCLPLAFSPGLCYTYGCKGICLYGDDMLDKLNRINVLYDIYGSLLTARQQEVLKLYFSDNLSLGEIAADYGISRQAVHDLIRRALSSIESFEEKLGLYNLFCFQQNLLQEACRILEKPLGAVEKRQLLEIIGELRRRNEQ